MATFYEPLTTTDASSSLVVDSFDRADAPAPRPDLATPVVFTVYVEEDMAADGQVMITGSTESLGNWTALRPMTRTRTDPCLWEIEVPMPYALNETYTWGLIEYSYTVVTRSGKRIEEPYGNLSESTLLPRYYHCFRKQYVPGTYYTSTDRFPSFVALELSRLLAGDLSPSALVARVDLIVASIPFARKDQIEDLFDQFIRAPHGAAHDLDFLLVCYLALVGRFGLARNLRDGHKSFANAGPQDPLRPRPWCHYVISHISIEAVMRSNLQRVLAESWRTAATGLVEAIERAFRYSGTLAWIRLTPALNSLDELPTPTVLDHLDRSLQRDLLDDFSTNLVPQMLGLASQYQDRNMPKTSWMFIRFLFVYAPSLTALERLVQDARFQVFGSNMADAFAERIEDHSTLHRKAELDHFRALLDRHPILKCASMAEALFDNVYMDNKMDPDTLLQLVTDCMTRSSNRYALARRHLVDAAKRWLRRNYFADATSSTTASSSAATTTTTGSSSGGWITQNSGFSFYYDPEPVKKSDQEIATETYTALRIAAQSWDAVLDLDCMSQAHRALLFEFNRGPFFKADRLVVLRALVSLADSEDGLGYYDDHLAEFLLQKITTLIAEHVQTRAVADAVTDLVNLVMATSTSHGSVSCFCLAYLASILTRASSAPLDVVLAHSNLWLRALTWEQAAADNQSPDDLDDQDLEDPPAPAEADAQAEPGADADTDAVSDSDSDSDTDSDDSASDSPAPVSATPFAGLRLSGTRFVRVATKRGRRLLRDQLDIIRNTLASTRDQLVSGAAPLRTVRTATADPESLICLSDALLADKLDRALLADLAARLSAFELQMKQVQAFVSLYCPSVGFDVTELETLVTDLTARYEDIPIKDTDGAFDAMVCLPATPWLYSLRTSDIFMALWAEVAARNQRSPTNAGELIAETAKILAAIRRERMQRFENAQPKDGNPLSDALAAMDPDEILALPRQLDPRITCTMCLEQFRSRNQLHHHIRTAGTHGSGIHPGAAKEVTQQMILDEIIPEARAEWDGLAGRLRSLSITVEELDARFAQLAPEQCLQETQLLGVEAAHSHLLDYLLSRKLLTWIPALLRLGALFAPLVKAAPDADPFLASLRDSLARLEAARAEQTLENIAAVVDPLRDLFASLDKHQIAFLTALAESESLIEWLVAHASTDEFNRMLKVCRPCTDEPRLLGSIASLVHVRTLLSAILYSLPPFADFRAFLEAFRANADMDGETGVWHLHTVQSNFEVLMDVFERQTRSPGIKACYDCYEILHRGEYILALNVADPNRALLCKVAAAADQSASIEPRILTLEVLADLRSKLLMTEIPEELAETHDMQRHVNTFVSQLRVLSEINDAMHALHHAGHPDFADSARRIYSGSVPVADLEAERTGLAARMQAWLKSVDEARARSYFLNFYPMRGLVALRDVLMRALKSPANDAHQAALVRSLLVAHPAADRSAVQAGLKAAAAALPVSPAGRARALDLAKAPPADTDGDDGQQDKQPTAHHLHVLEVFLQAALAPLAPASRPVALPSSATRGQGDLLISRLSNTEMAAQTRTLPVWVACSPEPDLVIDTVLSVYARRGRLPEAEELLFCHPQTTAEDVGLIVRRFIVAKRFGRGDRLFCVANIHLLSYPVQCAVHDQLEAMISVCGVEQASSLLLVSGLQHQMLMNALPSQQVQLVPLDKDILAQVCASLGDSNTILAVRSPINGGGKTHHILKAIAALQSATPTLRYHRVSVRECTDARALARALSSAQSSPGSRVAFHIDLGHALPDTVNTLLFRLFVVGSIRSDQEDLHETRALYLCSPGDHFFIEIPNTPGDRTAKRLSFAGLLPTKTVLVAEDELELVRPVFVDAAPPVRGEDEGATDHGDFGPAGARTYTRVALVEHIEMATVCKYLRAYIAGRFRHGSDTYNPAYDVFADDDIDGPECFRILAETCCAADNLAPSYLVFSSFVQFMHFQFERMNGYALLQGELLQFMEGLETFKQVFVSLLIRTSVEFSMRSVRPASTDPNMPVAEYYAQRFSSMTTWENSEHPIVLFYTSEGTHREVNGVDIISLNRRFIERYIRANLRRVLETNGISFDKDWRKMSSAALVQIIRDVEGYSTSSAAAVAAATGADVDADTDADATGGGASSTATPKYKPDYVLTVDSLVKILSIQLRIKYDLPVVIMGETGCGKTALISFMCETLGFGLRVLNVHGGITDEHIISWMEGVIREGIEGRARNPRHYRDAAKPVVVFLDEINTCNSMALFKEMVCDRSMDGRRLPGWIKIIAACNPYRLRKRKAAAAAAAEGAAAEGASKTAAKGEQFPSSLTAKDDDEDVDEDADDQDEVGLVFEHQGAGAAMAAAAAAQVTAASLGAASGIADPLKDLVYRVHPLPESMIDFVFDFGSLSEDTQRLYVEAIVRREMRPKDVSAAESKPSPKKKDKLFPHLNSRGQTMPTSLEAAWRSAHVGFQPPTEYDSFINSFKELLCAAQSYVRDAVGDSSAVSLRDIARCVQVLQWFGRFFAGQGHFRPDDWVYVRTTARPFLRTAVILSLAYCYRARLSRGQRRAFFDTVSYAWRKSLHYNGARWLDLGAAATLDDVVEKVQRDFVSNMNLGDGIAINEAILENLWMLLVSILNHIPIFVVGKPGSSKSLAMELIQANLNGDASSNEFLQTLVAVEAFSYQCSPLSTSSAIESVFEATRRYQRESQNTIVVVLLDEVGLAEQSPHLPLKVLHRELEHLDGISVVGISNWALDPAKMNRAVHLYRPHPTVQDLCATVEGMVASANLKGYLHSLARAYHRVYRGQALRDFWGLREFYSIVKHINRRITSGQELTPELLLNAVLRNFGGRPPSELASVIHTFFTCLGLALPGSGTGAADEVAGAEGSLAVATAAEIGDAGYESRALELVVQNLHEQQARHLMLLTRSNAALTVLFDAGVLDHQRTCCVFGSKFPLDQSDLHVCMDIQQIKLCMAEGITVVLVHCESLYESLYDVLNQHYVIYGGQRYVRLAFGSHSKLCPVHENFRIIVIVETWDAYNRLAPPLLNRFEKQVLERKHVLRGWQLRLVDRVAAFVAKLAGGEGKARKLVAGFHSDFVSSLVLALSSKRGLRSLVEGGGDAPTPPDAVIESLFREAVDRLVWLCKPEEMLAIRDRPVAQREALQQAMGGADPVDLYFQGQTHADLPAFVEATTKDATGASGVMVVTYSPISRGLAPLLGTGAGQVLLHELSSARDLERIAGEFFASTNESDKLLLVQCDPMAASAQQISHAKYICENAFSKARSGAVARHVLLVVHLSRGVDNDFVFDFDTRWRHVFIDCLEPAQGLPTLRSMMEMGVTVADVVGSIDLKSVLSGVFRTSLARLVYPFHREPEDIRNQISHLLQLLETREFIQLAHELILEVVRQLPRDDKLFALQDAEREHELSRSGTFLSALHQRLLSAVSDAFTVMVGHMDRNCGMGLFDAQQRTAPREQLWLRLLARSFREAVPALVGAHLTTGTTSGLTQLSLASDGFRGAVLRARFPFSFYIAQSLDALAEGVGAGAGEAALEQQGALVGLDKVLSRELVPQELVLAYVHDLVRMRLPSLKHPVVDMAQVVFSFLERPETVFASHARFCAAESRLLAYFELCEALPDDGVERMAALLAAGKPTEEALAACVMESFFGAVKMAAGEFVRRIRSARTIVETLAMEPLVSRQWQHLLLRTAYLSEVVIPVAGPQGTVRIPPMLDRKIFADDMPLTSRAFVRKLLGEIAYTAAGRSDKVKCEAACRRFWETYLFDFLLPSGEQLSGSVVTELANHVSGQVQLEAQFEEVADVAREIVPEASVAVIRALLALPRKSECALQALAEHVGFGDNHLAVSLLSVLDGASDAPSATLAKALVGARDQSSTRFLEAVARVRQRLEAIAGRYVAGEALDAAVAEADVLLDGATGKLPFVRSMRLFFLRNLERQCGPSYVRTQLTTGALSQAAFVKAWRAGNDDASFARFLGDGEGGNVPTVNPFARHEPYVALTEPVCASINGGDMLQLEEHVSRMVGQIGARATASALLMVFCQECLLLRCVSERVPPAVAKLVQWIGESPSLEELTQAEKRLLVVFVGGDEAAVSALGIGRAAAAQRVLQVRLVAHVASLAVAGGAGAREIVFGDALDKLFLPGMPDDERIALSQVLEGGWYACPNGHAYYVDACGRPTETLTCPECGADIGGLDHKLVDDNRTLDQNTEDYTPRGYVKESGAFALVAVDPSRNNTAATLTAHRLLVDAAMALRAGAGGPELFLDKQLAAAWTELGRQLDRNDEDVALLLHNAVGRLLSKGFAKAPVLESVSARRRWEAEVNQTVLRPLLETRGMAARVSALYEATQASDGGDGGLFVSELKETFSVEAMEVAERQRLIPALWKVRQRFSFAHLKEAVLSHMSREETETVPALREMLQDSGELRALAYLPDVLEWQRSLVDKLNRSLTREEARKVTVREAIAAHGLDQAAFDGFAKAWALGWPFVKRYGCLPIPAVYRSVEMTEETAVSFSLPNENDEGICPLALAQYLVALHNAVLERINGERDEAADHEAAVSSRVLLRSQAIDFDRTRLMAFVGTRAVGYTRGGDVAYDLERIERFVRSSGLDGRPRIELFHRAFNFANERQLEGLAVLRQRLTQVPLSSHVLEGIAKDLVVPANAWKCRQAVETCVSFLQATGGSFDADAQDWKLAEYVGKILLLDSGSLVSGTVVQHVCLKHLESLWALLDGLTDADPFATVREKYREEIRDDVKEALAECAPRLELDVLLPVLKEFIRAQLVEDHLGADLPLKMTIGFNEQLAEASWFEDGFPEGPRVGEAVSVYRFFSE